MGFTLNGSVIKTADGKVIGRYAGRKAELTLNVEGDPAAVLAFITATGAAYEVIHPPAAEIVITLDEDGDTAWTGVQRLDERTVKAGGERIRVHKSDADPWPSDLHGHVLDRPRTKVDAYDGAIYDTTTRKRTGTLGKRDLQSLQSGLRKDDWARAKLDARAAAERDGNRR